MAAVIGAPVRHSLSPTLHNAAFAALGLDWTYLAFEVAPGDAPAALVGMRALGLRGLSVTMPHKQAVAGAVDRLEADAAELGAVNCVSVDGGHLVGANTDGAGFVDSLVLDHGLDLSGRRALVLGAGGAGRAVVRALAGAGVDQVLVVNRTPAGAERAAALAGGKGAVGRPGDVAAVDLVVNATSVGMGAAPDDAAALPCPVEGLGPHQVVAELVYQPRETALMAQARARGALVVDGLGMLTHQAAHAFRRWTGVDAPVAAMRAALEAALEQRAGS